MTGGMSRPLLIAAPFIFLLLWSAGFAIAKIGLMHAGPFTLLALRYSIAVLVLLPLIPLLKPQFPRGRAAWDIAVVGFLSLVSGLDRETCRRVIDANVPGGVAQAIRDADTVFGNELPSLGAWEFGAEEAAAITQPILSVVGADTGQLWVEVAALLREWFPQLEELVVDGVGHLLQMQSAAPVATGVAEFLGRHAMVTAAGGARVAGGGAGR